MATYESREEAVSAFEKLHSDPTHKEDLALVRAIETNQYSIQPKKEAMEKITLTNPTIDIEMVCFCGTLGKKK